MPDEIVIVKNEYVLEIRFKPNAKILDKRGQWAEELSKVFDVNEWQITENRLDVKTNEGDKHAFISHMNTGIILYDVRNHDYFTNLSKRLLNFVFNQKEFGNPVDIFRIGVRGVFCEPYSGSFDELMNKYLSKFVSLTKEGKEAIGEDTKIIDVGVPINFEDKNDYLNLVSGPMRQAEFGKFFERKVQFPEVGLYANMDCWVEPKKKLSGGQTIEVTEGLFHGSWDRFIKIRDLLFKG